MKRWRVIPSWPEYEASSLGEIRRIGAKAALRPAPWRTGYLQVALWSGGRGKIQWVHRLVCEAFHGPPPGPKYDAAHGPKSRCKDDNRACNLRWATRAENEADKIKHGLTNRGSRNGMAVLSEFQVRKLRHAARLLPSSSGGARIKKGALAPLAAKYGITAQAARNIIALRAWRHVT